MKKSIFTLTLMMAVALSNAVEKGNENGNKTAKIENTSAAAHQISITGKVIDLNSGEALTGVEISVEGLSQKVYSDFDGNFKIQNIRSGSYNLIASLISYNKSFIEKLEIGEKGRNLDIKLQLTK